MFTKFTVNQWLTESKKTWTRTTQLEYMAYWKLENLTKNGIVRINVYCTHPIIGFLPSLLPINGSVRVRKLGQEQHNEDKSIIDS